MACAHLPSVTCSECARFMRAIYPCVGPCHCTGRCGLPPYQPQTPTIYASGTLTIRSR